LVTPVTKEIIQADVRKAMKERESLRVSTLRLLLAAVKNREIEQGKSLDEAELLNVINSAIKKRREAVEEYEKAGRPERAEIEREEMAILQAYLPPPLEEAELATLIEEAVRETKAEGPKDTGLIMKWIMPRVAGRADGRLVNQMVRDKLS
jgi:uncharacterized protein YqeY